MNRAIVLLAAAAGVCTVVVARPASALGPVDVEVGARVGGATNPISNFTTGNYLGFGVGGRAGVSVLGFYGGVSGMYYFGGGDLGSPSWLYGFDVGYSFKFLLLTVRPVLGGGIYTIAKQENIEVQQPVSSFYVEPGVVVLLGFGPWFAGADADVFLTPGLNDSQAAFMANGQVGVKF